MRRFLVVGLCALAVACSPQKTKKSGVPVARGSGLTITSDEFKARLEEQSPFIRARYSTLERKKEFLENLIRQELLALEAERQGLEKDPEVRATLRKIMVQKLVQRKFQVDQTGQPDVPDADVQKYYEEHKAEYVRPRRVRVHAVVLNAPAGSPERAKKLAIAKKALAKIRAEEKTNPLVFAQVVAADSDDQASKAAAGDLQFRSQEELASAYSPQLADAAFKLKPGETSGVVESPNALYLVKYTGEQPELNRTLDQVRMQITYRLSREKKAKEFDDWLRSLKEKARVEIDEKALDAVEVAAAPPGAPAAMMPGMPGMPGHGAMAPPAAQAPVTPAAPAARSDAK